MAASITDIKTGLKRAFEGMNGVRTYATQPNKPELPALTILGPVRWRYDQSMGPFPVAVYTFEVGIYVTQASDITRAQTELDAFLSPTGSRSILAALDVAQMTGQPLAGLVDYARAIGGDSYARLVDAAGTQALYANVLIEVMSS